jgi:hypothetical protein
VEFFRSWLLGLEAGEQDQYRVGRRVYDRIWMRDHLPDLIGRPLACWCRPGDPCHADVLLRIASGDDEACGVQHRGRGGDRGGRDVLVHCPQPFELLAWAAQPTR